MEADHCSTLRNDEEDHEKETTPIRKINTSPFDAYKDTWNGVYLIFLLFGIGGTVPWNFFITANGYWEYKFRDVNQTWPNHDPSKRTTLQAKFESYLSIAAMIPGLLCYILCLFSTNRCSLHSRIAVPSTIITVSFLFTILFAKLNTDSWQLLFFGITISLVALMNGSAAIFQASTFGFASSMKNRFILALMNGQAVGGLLASIGRILTLLADASESTSALYYFIGALIIVVACLIGYLILLRTSYYRMYRHQYKERKLLLINENSMESLPSALWIVFSKLKVYAISVTIVFLTTLSIFPAVATLVVSVNRSSGSVWTGKYFVPVTCFLLYNVGDLCGRCMANFITLIPSNSKILLTICILRVVYIPLFMLCNAHPRYYFPVSFDSDITFVILMATFALSNGYLASFCMTRAQKHVDPVYLEHAGILMSLFMAIGVASGAMLSSFVIILL